MSRTAHQFAQSSAVERRYTPRLDAWLQTSGYCLREATPAEQWRGIDRVAADPDGEYPIDYKCDEAWRRTRNVFIETVSNARTGRRGWALTSEAEWLLYFLTPDRVLVLTFTAVRRHLPTWQARYHLRAAVNDGYDTLGLCVPVSVIARTAEYTAWLDSGDAAILQRREAR